MRVPFRKQNNLYSLIDIRTIITINENSMFFTSMFISFIPVPKRMVIVITDIIYLAFYLWMVNVYCLDVSIIKFWLYEFKFVFKNAFDVFHKRDTRCISRKLLCAMVVIIITIIIVDNPARVKYYRKN